jgi:retron-type reverse transcriptase
MKTYKNLYSEICSFENLYLAFIKAKRRKRYKKGVGEFEYNLEKELFDIRRNLENLSYRPSKLKKFVLKEPKKRAIFVVNFKDRVVHHALCNVIEPIFNKSFIFDSYACRKNRGTHRAMRRIDEFKRKVTKNKTRKVHVLKIDMKKYFDNINHRILLEIIKKRIKDKRTLWLIATILGNYHKNQQSEEVGIPIGNLTSQLFANIYLNKLDHFIKEELRVKYYIRYMDDLFILSNSINFLLETKNAIDKFSKMELNLKLHPKKSKIFPLKRDIDFLGYRIFYDYKLLRKGSEKRIKNKLKFLGHEYAEDKKDLSQIYNSIMAWNGYSKWANTYKLRKELLTNLLFLMGK